MKASLFFKRGFAGPAALRIFLFSLFLMLGQWAWGQYSTGFEDATFGAYTDASFTSSSISWSKSEITDGNTANDYRIGNKSPRVRNRNGSHMTMTQNKSNGIGDISFNYRRYGTDTGQQEYRVDYSTDDGATWTLVGTFTPSNSSPSTFSQTVNATGNIRIRIIANSNPGASGDRRWNLDTLLITDYVSSCTSPTTQASAFSSSAIAQTTATVGWTRGSGDNVLVVARAGAAVNADPASGTSYTANAVFGSGTQIGTGNFVVYNGTGSSVNLTGLTAGTTYHFAVYEYNTTGICYNTTELTGNLTTASAPSLTATATLNEGTLNGATVNLALANTSFTDATLSAANFTLNNAPAGVSIQSVAYVSATSATITLAYNNTDFDTTINNFNITINGSELTSAANLTSNNLTISALAESLNVGSALAFGTVCNGSSSELSFTITGTNLKAGPITLGSLASYTYSESPGGVAITSFSQPGGTLNKTIYVTLTPTAANQTYNGNASVSGGAAPAVNKAVTGNSTVVTPAVVTNTVTVASITDTGATLRATSSTFGTCPATTTKGFVYAVNSVNSNPQNGGTGVITTTVTLGSAGSFTQPVKGLAEGTTYAYQAYLYNGTTYTYGGVQTFTTEFSGSLNTVTNTTACLTDDGGTISWSAPASGVSPTGYMVFAVTGATTPSDTASTSLADNNNANPNFSAGTNNATPASLGKLLYKGAATSVNISGLTENSIYSFLVLSYQDGGSVRRFNAAAAGGRALNNIAQDDVKTFTGTPSNTQVTLNWTYNSPTSCFDEVMIVANQGAVVFTPSGDGSLYTANAVYSTANQVVYKGTATSRAITGLTNGLEYCFKIWIRRGTTWSDGTVVCVIPEVVYCSIDSWSNLDSEITDVQLVGEGGSAISNATIGCTNTVQNYTSQNANLNRGGTYQVTVKFDDCNGGSFYNGTGGVWIDWNKDGDFADANEKIGTVAYDIATLDQPYTHTFTINVPSSQALGTYRMRVMQDEGATELNIDACTAPGYGAIEDYSITVIQPANAEINIKGGAANISIPNGFDEPYGLNNTLFAGTPINTDSAEKEFTIENLGLANLTLTGTPIINISGDHPSDFIVTQQAVSPVVNGVSTSFKIKFHPTVAGVRQADVSIASNDSDENPYIFRIQGTGTCAPLSITASPASGPVNTVVTFTSSVTDLSSATVTYNEVAVPTISATANKLEVAVPLGALDANFQVNLPNGCNFTHAFDVISSVTTDCEATTGGPSETPATDLIIYEVYDVKTGSGGVISIFNRTGFPVSLSSYSIQRSRDHTNLPGEPYYTYANLTGTLAAGGLAVVGVSTDNAACDYSAILTGNGSFGSGFNEDDGFRLVKGSIVVDVVHAPNTTGYYLRRKSENLSPSATYVSTQWTNQFLSEDQCLSDVGQTPSVKTPPIVDAHPSFAISCEVEGATLAITATQGVSGGNGLTFQWYVLPSSGGSWTAVTDGGVYSGATSATLNISNLTGLHNYQYYAQVRENTATCYTATNAVQIKEATNTWASNAWSSGTPVLASKVIIAGSYDTEINGALDVCELTVSTSGTMVVKPNYPVQVKKKIINQNTAENSFVVLSDANLIQIDDTDNEGTIKVERSVVDMDNTLPQIDYLYWSSPVFEQLIKGASGFSPNTPATGYQQYRESDDRFVTTPDTYFQAGKGYSIRSENVLANGYNKTYSFTGVPNNGDVSSPPLSKSPGADKGYNLIGNPYPSNIDFDLLYALNSSKIYNTAWLWTNLTYTPTQMGSDYEGNNYAVYNGTGGVPPASDWADYDPENPSGMIPNGNIKVGQGFIVQLKLAGVVDFKNNMRITDGGTFYQKGETKNRFWLTMRSPKNMVNTILIGYIPGATNAYETDFDGELFVVGSDSFYTVSGAKKLAIQGRDSNFTNADVVPLANVFSEAGTYTIGLHTPEGIFNGTQNIFLKDKLLSKYINLSTDTSYTFTAVKGTDATRFEIVYKESSVLGNDDISKSDFTVYRNGNSFVVKSSKILGKVEVYDAGGRLIRQLSSKENTLTIDATDLPNAVYIIKAENEGDIKTKKILK